MGRTSVVQGNAQHEEPREIDVLAHLSTGTAIGEEFEDGVCEFLGIPFAAPPARWRRAGAALPWEGSLDCRPYRRSDKRFKKPIQFISGELNRCESEDCLYASVWAPTVGVVRSSSEGRAPSTLAPVIIFIDGGGLVKGYVGDPTCEGKPYARRGVLCVQGNYRHGPLGFMRPLGSDANCGLWDMVSLLRWVRAEIRAFGGDPNNVTVQGQSGGSDLTLALCCSPVANHLFQRAIIESPSTCTLDAAQADEIVVAFAAAAGAKSARHEDLSRLTVKQIKLAFEEKAYPVTPTAPGMGFAFTGSRSGSLPNGEAPRNTSRTAANMLQCCSPTFLNDPSLIIDGELVPEKPLDALLHGAAAHLDIIIAGNRAEALGDLRVGNAGIAGIVRRFAWELAVAPGARAMTAVALRRQAEQLVKAYEVERDRDPVGLLSGKRCGRSPTQQVLNLIFSDFIFGAHAHLAAERLASPGCCRRLYRLEVVGKNGAGAHHTEGFLTVGEWDENESGEIGGNAHAAGMQWMDLYLRFARTGDPNSTCFASTASASISKLHWPCYEGAVAPVTLSMDLEHGASVSIKGTRVSERPGFRKLLKTYEKLWEFEQLPPAAFKAVSRKRQRSDSDSLSIVSHAALEKREQFDSDLVSTAASDSHGRSESESVDTAASDDLSDSSDSSAGATPPKIVRYADPTIVALHHSDNAVVALGSVSS